MLLTLIITEQGKRTSSVATYRAPHNDIDRAVNDQDPPIADQLMTTPHAAACTRRLSGKHNFGLVTEVSSA